MSQKKIKDSKAKARARNKRAHMRESEADYVPVKDYKPKSLIADIESLPDLSGAKK